MAEITGVGGSVTFSGLTANVHSWSITESHDIFEKTDFADGASGYKTRLAGLPDWTATVELFWDAANTADSGDSAALTLTATSGKTYTGTAMVESVTVNTSVADPITATYNFVGNGALTVPTA